MATRLFSGRKAQVEVQFNWIFVVIVGAVLLIFFASIVTKQKQTSETKLAATVSADLASILAGASVSTGTFELIDIPKLIINMDCDFYRIGAISKQFKDKIVFGASRLEGEQLITWSLDWSVPFKVANFLLITTPNMRFIIAGSENFAQEIYDELPPTIMVKDGQEVPAMSKGSGIVSDYENTLIESTNNFKVRIVFFSQVGSVPEKLKYLPDADLTAVVIKGNDFSSGQLEFYQFSSATGTFELQPEGTTKYIGMAGLFAAIFADRVSDYNCLMNKAFKKLNAVAKVYAERDELLLSKYGEEGSYCAETYYQLKDSSEEMAIANEAAKGFEGADLAAIQTAMSGLQSRNTQALIASCAQIY